MTLDELHEMLAKRNEKELATDPVEHLTVTTPKTDDWRSQPTACDQDIDEQLAHCPTGKAVFYLVRHNDKEALRLLVKLIRCRTWNVPPFDAGDQESAALEHLWDTIRKKAANNPSPAVVLRPAHDGAFEYVPNEVRNRFIDDARKASAKKRGGDGKHMPIFDRLSGDGDVERRLHDDAEGEAQWQPARDTYIQEKVNEVWHRITAALRWQEIASGPMITELGAAARLYRFYLEHPDAEHWTDVEIAHKLGVTDRTIRNYLRRVRPFVKKYLL